MRQADQVSDRQERAHGNESRRADGEQNSNKLDLLDIEVEDPHVGLPDSRLRSMKTARQCVGEKAVKSLASVP